ncbi:hypothetical protein BBJ66_04975 [Rhizobium sp. RSm-3]|nr:hypothetical protein BBJ66_04975 [Rhizobium sp. RSm-3]
MRSGLRGHFYNNAAKGIEVVWIEAVRADRPEIIAGGRDMSPWKRCDLRKQLVRNNDTLASDSRPFAVFRIVFEAGFAAQAAAKGWVCCASTGF